MNQPNNEYKILFGPGEIGTESQTFDLPVGTQQTVVAVGLEAGDMVQFEIVVVNKLIPGDPCCPGPVRLPTIEAMVPLMCCGERITLTPERPYVVIDAPQGSLLRAILTSDSVQVPLVWTTRTTTPNPSGYHRGCPC